MAGDNNVPSVKIGNGIDNGEQKLCDFIAEFERDENGHYNHEDTLCKAAIDGKISEQDFMDWYVICRFKDAIIPPVTTGYPRFTPLYTSVLAGVLRSKPELYEISCNRKVRDREKLSAVLYGTILCLFHSFFICLFVCYRVFLHTR